MTTTNDPRSRKPRRRRRNPRPRRDGIFRFSIDQLKKMDELGFFEDRKVELIEGVLYEMVIKPPHSVATELGAEALRGAFGPGYVVRQQNPLELNRRSLPQPDLVVVPGTIRDYLESHPTHALLVVEVREATLQKDRTVKAHLDARAGIADYWIVNLVDRRLEVHRDPGPDPDRKGRFRYAHVTIVPADGHASPLAKPEARIAVADLLP